MLTIGTRARLLRNGVEGVIRGVKLEDDGSYSYLVLYRVDENNENMEWVHSSALQAA